MEPKVEIDYYAKIADALDLIGEPHPLTVSDVLKAKGIFNEINDYVQDVPLFKENAERRQEYKEFFTKEVPNIEERIVQCWVDFLSKSVSAPTSFHVIGCVILQTPILHEFITEYINTDPSKQ